MLTSESIKKIEKNDHKQMFPRKFMGIRGVFFRLPRLDAVPAAPYPAAPRVQRPRLPRVPVTPGPAT